MIRKILLLLALGFVFVANAQKKYEINFYIHEIEDSVLYIGNYIGVSQSIIDSIRVKKDGSFHWETTPLPKGMYMIKDQNKKDMFSFLLADSPKFSIEIYNNGESFVKGCEENEAYLLYQGKNSTYQTAMYFYRINVQATPNKRDSLYAELQPIMDSFEVFQKNFYAKYPNNFITIVQNSLIQNVPSYFVENGSIKRGMEKEYAYYFRKHYWDNFHFEDNRILYSPYFIKKFNVYISEITTQTPDSVCVALDDFITQALKNKGVEYADYVLTWYLNTLPTMPFSFNELVYKHIMDKYYNYLKALFTISELEQHQDYLEKISKFLPGNTMPNIIATDVEGKPHSLYESKHRFTILYFFASTCESCKKNLNILQDLYSRNKDYYDLEIFSIDLEADVEIGKARQRMEPYPWIVTFKAPEELREYGFILDHTPELYVLDKDKKILNKTAMYEHVEKVMDAAMKSEQR
ncbi:MAG: DUF5106 domain-containing protein [Bacteroidota bacterium]|nr:DUF5106 domain-containing protein [Bacteroidota bacterium]